MTDFQTQLTKAHVSILKLYLKAKKLDLPQNLLGFVVSLLLLSSIPTDENKLSIENLFYEEDDIVTVSFTYFVGLTNILGMFLQEANSK